MEITLLNYRWLLILHKNVNIIFILRTTILVMKIKDDHYFFALLKRKKNSI